MNALDWSPAAVISLVVGFASGVLSCWLLHLANVRANESSLLGVGRRMALSLAGLLCLGSVASLAWWGSRAGKLPRAPEAHELVDEATQMIELAPDRSLHFYTDRGRRVRTYQPATPTPEGWEPPEAGLRLQAAWLERGKLLRTTLPDRSHNCHGWTFAAGCCWIQNADAEIILQDNGYRAVDQPRLGDIVAYADRDGRLCHTGVIVGQNREGILLVESKWGYLGHFIHAIGDQPYATRWGYFHSHRHGHDLEGLSRHDSNSELIH